ncbi:hypothetical protein FRIGORI9N_310166 [Frigoribacterium sp. 9N]|nr:hypothetical protein FRIGORI9N_310166 [Frigoribacterium sp. 9N]
MVPSSGVMKPKPFSELNHLTVPVAIFLVPSIRVVDLDFEIARRGAFLSAPSENDATVGTPLGERRPSARREIQMRNTTTSSISVVHGCPRTHPLSRTRVGVSAR